MCSTIGTDSSEDDDETADDPGQIRAIETSKAAIIPILTDTADMPSEEEESLLEPIPLSQPNDTTKHSVVPTARGLALAPILGNEDTARGENNNNHSSPAHQQSTSTAAIISPKTDLKAAYPGEHASATATTKTAKTATTEDTDDSTQKVPTDANTADTTTAETPKAKSLMNKSSKKKKQKIILVDNKGTTAKNTGKTTKNQASTATKIHKEKKGSDQEKTPTPKSDTADPGSTRANPDTTLLAANESDEDGIFDDNNGELHDDPDDAANTGEQLSPISKFSLPPSDLPAIDTPSTPSKTMTTKTFSRARWYLLWSEAPSFLANALPGAPAEDWVQLWIPRAIDFLYDHGFTYNIGSLYEESKTKALKRREHSFSAQLARTICSYDDFQDFFEIQPLFTHQPYRVEVSFFRLVDPSTKTSADYFQALNLLRAQFGIVSGKRTQAPYPPPSFAFPPAFSHVPLPHTDKRISLPALARLFDARICSDIRFEA